VWNKSQTRSKTIQADNNVVVRLVDAQRTASIAFLVFVVGLLLGVAYYQDQLSSANYMPTGNQLSVSQFSLVGIESIGVSSTELMIQFKINNPTLLSVTLKNASYILYGNRNYLGAGVITQQAKILSRTSTTMDTNFDATLSGSSHVLWSYFLSYGNKVSWEAKGNATLSEPLLGNINIQFDCKSSPPQYSVACASLTGSSG
jgi:LEA14-like dessication related protein